MKDLLDKLSSYNVFNYLFPGVIFAAAGTSLTSYALLMNDMVVGLFVYYFYGLAISRFGSLVLEPIFKKTRFVRFAPYDDFVAASKEDEKLALMLEENNMHRTLSSMLLCLLFLLFTDLVVRHGFDSISPICAFTLVLLLLFSLFSFSYRKQTGYIRSCVERSVGGVKETRPNELRETEE